MFQAILKKDNSIFSIPQKYWVEKSTTPRTGKSSIVLVHKDENGKNRKLSLNKIKLIQTFLEGKWINIPQTMFVENCKECGKFKEVNTKNVEFQDCIWEDLEYSNFLDY